MNESRHLRRKENSMQEILRLLLAVLVLLTGCGKTEEALPPEIGFRFTWQDTQIVMNTDAAEILEALGEPVSYTEEASCAFDGMDKTYYFGSFYMTTYPENGKDYVYSLWFADDSVATEEGIRIGDSQEAVERVYDRECFNGDNAYILEKGESRLTIILTDGVVSSVLYEAVLT